MMTQSTQTIGSKQLHEADYQRTAEMLGVEVAAIKAVVKVEAAGRGFLADGRPKILFERHWFWKLTPLAVSKTRPDISNPTPGGYLGGTREWNRLEDAMQFDKPAALKSASWGLGQVMGFNHQVAGYSDVESFVEAMWESEGKQLDAMMTFIKNHPAMVSALRRHNWAAFARAYNGPAYKKNQYDTKLAVAFNEFKQKGTKPLSGSSISNTQKASSKDLVIGKATVKFIGGSYLKRLPEQSSQLKDDQKVLVKKDQEFVVEWYEKQGNHLKLGLKLPVAGIHNWYAYAAHLVINDQPVVPTIITPSTTTDEHTQLSPHFKLWEFVVSETASRYGIDNTPQKAHIERLRTLCQEILEPARLKLGPLRINSGYRSPALNKAIRGSSTSAHMQGYAADVNPLKATKMDFAKWVKNNCQFDQVILEFGTPREPAWIHVSCDPKRRKQVIKTVPGGYAVAHI